MARYKIDVWLQSKRLKVKATQLKCTGFMTREPVKRNPPVEFYVKNYMNTKHGREGWSDAYKVSTAFFGSWDHASWAKDAWKMFFGFGNDFVGWSCGYGVKSKKKIVNTFIIMTANEKNVLYGVIMLDGQFLEIENFSIAEAQDGKKPVGSTYVETGGTE